MTIPYRSEITFLSKNDPVDKWTITSSSAQAGYPITEIQNDSVGLVWRSTQSTLDQWVEGNVVSGTDYVDSIALVNHNLQGSTASTVRVQTWQSATPVHDGTYLLKGYDAVAGAALVDEIRPYRLRIIYLPTSTTTSPITRWRLTFSDPFVSAPGIVWEVARVFATLRFRPSDNFDSQGCQLAFFDNSRFEVSYGNNQNIDSRPRKRSLSIQMNLLRTQTDLLDWLYLFGVNGKRQAIVVDPHPLETEGTPSALEMPYNTLWQLYGTLASDVQLSRATEGISVFGGRIMVEEAL